MSEEIKKELSLRDLNRNFIADFIRQNFKTFEFELTQLISKLLLTEDTLILYSSFDDPRLTLTYLSQPDAEVRKIEGLCRYQHFDWDFLENAFQDVTKQAKEGDVLENFLLEYKNKRYIIKQAAIKNIIFLNKFVRSDSGVIALCWAKIKI